MKYFDYQTQTSMSRVWMLFKDMGTVDPAVLDSMPAYSHTLDIVKAALSGSISLTDDAIRGFNLSAYEYKCRENDRNSGYETAKTELHIVETDNTDDEIRVGMGDVSDRTLHFYDDAYEKVARDDEFKSYLRELVNCRSKYIVEMDIDVVNVLISSLKGISSAITDLKSVIAKDARVGEIVTALCESCSGNSLVGILEAVAV